MSIAVCPGSFDPITLGHVDIVERAAQLFDRVVVGVATNSSKTPLLSVVQRLDLARDALKHVPNVEVAEVPGLLVDFCAAHGAQVIVKGIRGSNDFDGETPMALMNQHLSGVETVFMHARPQYAHIASSLVKDVMRFGGDVADMVPPKVHNAMVVSMGEKNMFLGKEQS
ncbi:pantetheine-phosphate adenylyltransferase [Timonella sp. A28]|uniref:pantetheine-phosphate adenylyltransferase n=1 Tax=Timonella sp. A28 TaxID=3442640 RepID=UPI003EC14291